MIQVNHNDFMRAIAHHKLNALPNPIGNYVSNWSLSQNYDNKYIGTTTSIFDYQDRQFHHETSVTDEFKVKYIDTTPDNVWRCRTCSLKANCSIVRTDLNDHCCGWKNQTTIKHD